VEWQSWHQFSDCAAGTDDLLEQYSSDFPFSLFPIHFNTRTRFGSGLDQSWQPATIFEDLEQHWAVVKLAQHDLAAAFLVTFFTFCHLLVFIVPDHC